MDNSNLNLNKAVSFDDKPSSDDIFNNKGFTEDLDQFFSQAKPIKTDLDLDKLYKENAEKQNLNNKGDDLENAGNNGTQKESSRIGKILQYISVDYFKGLFDVNTQDVMDRLRFSIFPFKTGTLFKDKPYDLYGPVWIVLTVVFTTSIFGTVFMTNQNLGRETAASMSIHQIGKSFTLTMFYLVINPLVIFYYLNKEGARSVQYFEIVSIYGYSFTFLPIVEVLLIVPFGLLNFAFLIIGIFISSFLIRKELIELNQKYLPRREVKHIRNYGIISHAVWLVLFKLLFL